MKFWTLKDRLKWLAQTIEKIELRTKSCETCGGRGVVEGKEYILPSSGVKGVDTTGRVEKSLPTTIRPWSSCQCQKGGEMYLDDYKAEFDKMIKIDLGIPVAYKNPSLNDKGLLSEAMRGEIMDFIYKDDRKTLFITGQEKGIGKTHTVFAIKNFMAANKLGKMRFLTEYELLDVDRAVINKNKNRGDETNPYDRELLYYEGCGILAIDDVGISAGNYDKAALLKIYFKIADYRWKNGLKTIYTSNLSLIEWANWLDEVDKHQGGRILSRVSGGYNVVMHGVDHRAQLFAS